jgi:hypothetical protein
MWIAQGLETAETRGMLKAVVDAETERLVSFSAIVVEGGEIVAVVQMAMVGVELDDALPVHSSWAECLNNVWGGKRRRKRKEGRGDMRKMGGCEGVYLPIKAGARVSRVTHWTSTLALALCKLNDSYYYCFRLQ